MKKILLVSIAYLLGNISFAQLDNSQNNVKNFRFGLKGNLSIDWMNPENKKKYVSNGSSLGYGWGAQLEYRLNKTASLVTGVGLQTSFGKINYSEASSSDRTFYVLNKDEEFQEFNQTNINNPDNKIFLLQDRKYKINYVTLPIALKMKTKEIGYFTYYGTFGLNLGIKTKAIVEDNVTLSDTNSVALDAAPSNKEDLDISRSVQIGRTGIIIGGGAEYTISGTTAVFFDLTYNYFFSNAIKNNDKYLGIYKDDNFNSEIKQKFIPGSVALTVGILF